MNNEIEAMKYILMEHESKLRLLEGLDQDVLSLKLRFAERIEQCHVEGCVGNATETVKAQFEGNHVVLPIHACAQHEWVLNAVTERMMRSIDPSIVRDLLEIQEFMREETPS